MIPISKVEIGDEEKKEVLEVLNSGMITQGKKVAQLEEEFAKYCGSDYAVAVNSGTAALHGALNAIGIKEGSEVITSPFTFVATASPILMCNAKPVFVDVNENTFNIDPEKIKEKITPKTKAIITVDLYGQCADYGAIKDIAEDHNLKIIEDACQAVGAEYHGKKAGTLGDISAFSFYATKNLLCGEGGIITTNSKEYAESVRLFRHHGQSKQYEFLSLGYNYRMTDIMAAIAIVNLRRIDKINEKRIMNADFLDKIVENPPYRAKNQKHVFHQYTITSEKRDKLKEDLFKAGIGSNIYYPKPLHLHPLFSHLRHTDLKVSEYLSERVLSLPVHQHLGDQDKQVIKSFFEEL
jgi:perosamine synthetase